ncbi:alpha-glucosidase [Acidaminobacter sp. JC074]|uniref:glycoside hydrolase family 13 protein n=1 Tax=Acidaminobacter sp. JC074 TaxID=2530199 RepID=UPI001F109091|nr:alpha-glucosidase [Acidaminobacter sp. JC074]MCH4889094.1 alpha-glucosidase [Acidaminobacter sp. JC074]
MKKMWWHDSVIYQIYPRSFKDSNGDGIGDINGIIEKIDYLKDLGVDIVWLSPVYTSPMDDNGYDISDYQNIASEFGSLEEMDKLIKKCDEKGISIMMDLVVNHTSDEHEWFVESKKSKDNPYRDYYIWRDGQGDYPNDIISTFSGPAWDYDEKTDQYYFHLFSKKQPDLNWDNEKMRNDIYQMMNWWLDRGIRGFRMDVIDLIGKNIDKKIVGNGPTLHERLQEMNQKTFGHRDIVTVGETWGATPEIAKLYSKPERNELSMVFQFEHVTAFHDEKFGKWASKPVDFSVIKDILSKWQVELKEDGWNSLFWNNHDLPRVVSKYGNEAYRDKSAKMLATMIHMMKGTPYIYQGEEIGMTNVQYDFSDYRDIELINAYHDLVPEKLSHDQMMTGIYADGRDNARTPMQWDSSQHGGFTSGQPWLKVNPNYKDINVKECLENKVSIFYYYKKLIDLRKKHDVIVYGDFKRLYSDHPDLFVYERTYMDEKLLVILNHTDKVISKPQGLDQGHLIISNYQDSDEEIRPYEALVYSL